MRRISDEYHRKDEILIVCKDSGHKDRPSDIASFVPSQEGWSTGRTIRSRRKAIVQADKFVRPRMRTGRNYNPYEHAASLGIQVLFRSLRKYNGLWGPDYNTIWLRSGMPNWSARCTLAHEIAHATLGHRDSPPELEWAADALAGWQMLGKEGLEVLISRLEEGQDPTSLAQSFGVTRKILGAVASPLSPTLIWPEGGPK